MAKNKFKKKATGLKNFTYRIILKFTDEMNIPYGSNEKLIQVFSEHMNTSWKDMLKKYPGLKLGRSVTSIKPGEIDKLMADAKEEAGKMGKSYHPPNLHNFLKIEFPVNTNYLKLLEEIQNSPNVKEVYVQPWPVPGSDAASAGSFKAKQRYLKPAPVGVDAKLAWRMPGGDGNPAIRFVDLENGWDFTHPDLPQNAGTSTIGTPFGINKGDFDHGTNVLGVVLGQRNRFGIDGIAPMVKADAISSFAAESDSPNLNEALAFAINLLDSGDVLLITLHSPNRALDFLPVEIDSEAFHYIQAGTMKGVIIIEIAGNGIKDLDSPQFNSLIKTGPNDSGAILVGACKSRMPHNRFPTSNFGSRVDCYAWGEKIVTTNPGQNPYIFDFGQTSGAAAIIAGVALSIQGIYFTKNGRKLNCTEMRKLFQTNGTPSTDSIGVMPDIKAIDNLIQTSAI
jgi:hypothetical protein